MQTIKIKLLIIISCFYILILIQSDDLSEKWIKYKFNPVLGNLKTGSLFDPFVFNHEGIYKMYVSWRKEGTIALSLSKDGINWSFPKTVLNKGNESSWESIVNRASILMLNEKYFMWYTGQNNMKSEIGFAFSKDGYNFTKYKNNPIMSPEYEFEKKSVMNPHVIYDREEKIFKMWYAAGETYEPDIICYATSKNGINWIKYEKNPIFIHNLNKFSLDYYKIGGCDIHKFTDYYLMFYIGYTDINTARIFVAMSKNGIHNWKRKNFPIISPTKNQFDCNACYKPTAIFDKNKNKWLIWYNGRKENNEYIGLATHNTFQITF